jgi:hypothetical protein
MSEKINRAFGLYAGVPCILISIIMFFRTCYLVYEVYVGVRQNDSAEIVGLFLVIFFLFFLGYYILKKTSFN